MKLFRSMVFKSVIPVFLTALLFFVLILELADIVTNLWRYINNNVEIIDIVRVALYYVPKCVSFSAPLALLFSISFSLGNFYSNNELISVFNSGVPLVGFAAPFLLLGLLVSLASFVFEERVVIETYKKKQELSDVLLKRRANLNNNNVVRLTDDKRVLFAADYYNDVSQTLSGVVILVRDEGLDPVKRIDAEKAEWRNEAWTLTHCSLYTMQDGSFLHEWQDEYTYLGDVVRPEAFQRPVINIDQMTAIEARNFIVSLRKAGLPVYRSALTEYYERFAFALTPLVVALLSCSIGGRYKKNILLMSLFVSLAIAVVYYVMQFLAVLLAKQGYINPIIGAWFSFFLFLFISGWLLRTART